MDTSTLVKKFLEVPREPTDIAARLEAQANDADAARSEDNILRWMAYLPEDCITTMIAMGWDITT